MQRILDRPLPSYPADDRRVHFNQPRANAGHVEYTMRGDQTPPTSSTRQGESAPTSIARTEASMDGNGRAWATGSLSLPGSASLQPLASDLDKQQCRCVVCAGHRIARARLEFAGVCKVVAAAAAGRTTPAR